MTPWLTNFLRIFTVVGIVCIPGSLLFAEGYVQLVGVPGLPSGGNVRTTGEYVNALYTISIGVAAFLAVVRIIFAGAKYILSDIVTEKGNAKKDIQNAIIGLLVVLSAVLLLQTINRGLINFNVLDTLETVTVEIEETPVPERDIQDDRDLDSVDVSDMTVEEIRAEAQKCAQKGGNWVVYGSTNVGVCLGNESESSEDNLVNTQGPVNEYFAANPTLTPAQRLAFQQRYNQFVGTQEPEGMTAARIEQIKTEQGAEEVVFVVKHETLPSPELIAYEATQEQLCRDITGSENFVVGDGYAACVR